MITNSPMIANMAGILFKGTLQCLILIIVYLACQPTDWFANAEKVASGQVSNYYYQAALPTNGAYTAIHTWYGLREMQCASKCSSDPCCIAFLWDPPKEICITMGHDDGSEGEPPMPTPSQSLLFYANAKYGHLFAPAESGSGEAPPSGEAEPWPPTDETPPSGDVPPAELAPQLVGVPPTEDTPQLVEVPPTESVPQLVEVPPTESAPQLVGVPPTESAPQLVGVPPTEDTPQSVEVQPTMHVSAILPVTVGIPPLAEVPPTESVPEPSESIPCSDQADYRLVTYNDLTRCVYVSLSESKFSDAKETCAGHGGRLFKANSLELMVLANVAAFERGLAGNSGVITGVKLYIGLDDLLTEDTFVWSDGQEMSSWERETLFKDPEPDNYQNEDCVFIPNRVNFSYLADVQCSLPFRFVCEIVSVNV